MKQLITDAIRSVLKFFNIGITRFSTLENVLTKLRQAESDLELLCEFFAGESNARLHEYLKKSKSQLRQDLFVLSQLNFKRNGFFVEFGATNGVDISNTHLMEKEFGWTGILAEPARCWHEALAKNRSCRIETLCVWKDSHSTLTFNEVDAAELSTIDTYSAVDGHSEARKKGTTYDVKTISLNDLLEKHKAPAQIDYLSIDTEGSEFEILSNLDFSKYSFRLITCEHNYTPMREKIFELLTNKGYVRLYENLSRVDDWYIKST
jgi:FkbM family methyltransferase